jgi:WD40 repeat protein
VLLSAGYEKKISVFEVNPTFLDTCKRGSLTGHESLITSFIALRRSPMVVSADDKGKVKVWDIRNYKCVQTVDFRDKTNITKLLDMVELGQIGVFGSRINFV